MEQINPLDLYRKVRMEYIAKLKTEVDNVDKELAKIGELASDPSTEAYKSLSRLTFGVTYNFREPILLNISAEFNDTCTGIEALLKRTRRKG